MRAALPVLVTLTALTALLVGGRPRGAEALGDGAEVLARLPERSVATTRDPAQAAQTAREAIERARAERDPRWLGRAQAALRPWWSAASPPHDILVLRATIKQTNHDFEAALADLAVALKQDPSDGQAWLTQAVLQQVRGDLDGARASCAPLGRLADEIIATACRAAVAGATGAAPAAATELTRALDRAAHALPGERAWALGILAELLSRQGDRPGAEGRLREALALSPRDSYLLGSLADLLIDDGRPAEAAALLEKETDVDGLLLRLAIAETRAGAPGAAGHAAELRRRHAQARTRGDAIHVREEARRALELDRQPRAALALAQEDWTVQREPADARLLLEAAIAAGQPAAARPVVELMARTGLRDATLDPLAREVAR